jgi:hypothetical protein
VTTGLQANGLRLPVGLVYEENLAGETIERPAARG